MADQNLDIHVKIKRAGGNVLKTVKNEINALGKSAKSVSAGLSTIATAMTALAAVLGTVTVVMGKAVKDFAAFDDNMRAAGAVTKATAEEMELMTEAAKEMGRTTRYTASQAAEALRFMGMAGLEASEAVTALPGVLNLAAAGALDLGTAADIATNVLSGFGLEVERLGRVNDVLVQTFTNANVNLVEIGEAFKIVGPIAKGVGANFEDLVGTIGALGNAGIKGTLAGTALKNAIDALLAPTKKEAELMNKFAQRIGQTSLQVKDANGDFIGFAKVIEQVEKSGARGDEILQAFGMRAGPGLAALMNMGSEALDELIMKLEEAGGVSEEIAEKMEAGIGGEIRRTISILESLSISLGEALGPKAIEFLKRFQEVIKSIIAEVQRLADSGELRAFGDLVIDIFDTIVLLGEKTYRVLRLIGAGIANIAALATGDLGVIRESVKGINEEIALLTGTFQEEVVTGVITDQMVKEFEEAANPSGPIGKGAEKVNKTIADKIIEYPTIETKLKAALIRINGRLKEESETIKSEYQKGIINLEQYYDERSRIINEKIQAELNLLRNRLESETDVQKRELLNAQIFAKEKQLAAAIVQLESSKQKELDKLAQQRVKAEERVNRLQLRAEKAMIDQKARIRAEGQSEVEFQQEKELADLETKQDKELASIQSFYDAKLELLRQQKASEEEIERLSKEKEQALAQQTLLQNQETAQLIAEQQAAVAEAKLQQLQSLASDTATLFTDLYNLTGQKSKEFFYIAKAAAIAQATMSTAAAVMKAWEQGGIFGAASAAIIAAQGAVQIATIASQSLASGGEVAGSSPTATSDDKLIAATSGEFMQPVSSVKYYGKDFMEAIRTRALPKGVFSGYFAAGGMVGETSMPDVGTGEETPIVPAASEINIINVTDPNTLDEYLASAKGQDAILNVLGARPEAARRLLGGA